MGKIDKMRAATMRRRLGKASNLIDDDQYLPLYRNRQINYKSEFEYSVDLSKTKRNPSAWLAKIWSSKMVGKTVAIMRKMMNLAKCKALALLRESRSAADNQRAAAEMNPSGRIRYEQMRQAMLSGAFKT